MDKKRERAIKEMIIKAGLTCDQLETTGGNHIKALLRNNASMARKVIFSSTPSDHRGDLNRMALLRRFARELPQ